MAILQRGPRRRSESPHIARAGGCGPDALQATAGPRAHAGAGAAGGSAAPRGLVMRAHRGQAAVRADLRSSCLRGAKIRRRVLQRATNRAVPTTAVNSVNSGASRPLRARRGVCGGARGPPRTARRMTWRVPRDPRAPAQRRTGPPRAAGAAGWPSTPSDPGAPSAVDPPGAPTRLRQERRGTHSSQDRCCHRQVCGAVMALRCRLRRTGARAFGPLVGSGSHLRGGGGAHESSKQAALRTDVRALRAPGAPARAPAGPRARGGSAARARSSATGPGPRVEGRAPGVRSGARARGGPAAPRSWPATALRASSRRVRPRTRPRELARRASPRTNPAGVQRRP